MNCVSNVAGKRFALRNAHFYHLRIQKHYNVLLVFYFDFIFVVSPSIEPQSRTIYILSGKAAVFPCNYTGFPTSSVYWTVTHSNTPTNITQGNSVSVLSTVDGRVLQTLEVFVNGTLHISNVDQTDSAVKYQCTAVNRLGVAKADVKLTVVGGMTVLFPLYCTVLI